MKFIRDEQTNLDKKRSEEKNGTVNIKLMTQKKKIRRIGNNKVIGVFSLRFRNELISDTCT